MREIFQYSFYVGIIYSVSMLLKAFVAITLAGVVISQTPTPLPEGTIRPHGLEAEERIFYGYKAGLGDFPFQVLLNIQDAKGRGSFCGGTIISDKWILTTGRCLEKSNKVLIYMGLLNSQKRNDAIQQFARKLVRHPKYNRIGYKNDIALLRVRKKINFTDSVKPINLPKLAQANSSSWDNQFANVSGYGVSNAFDTPANYDLLWRNVKIIAFSLCQVYHEGRPLNENNVCTRAPAGPCKGDTGGPLSMDNVLVGLSSWSIGYCGDPEPTVYVNVAAHLKWIKSVTRIPIS